MARPRKKANKRFEVKEEENIEMEDIGIMVDFDYRPGQKVLTKFNDTGFITCCQVNAKNTHMYYVETGIDKGGWLYAEDFTPIFTE